MEKIPTSHYLCLTCEDSHPYPRKDVKQKLSEGPLIFEDMRKFMQRLPLVSPYAAKNLATFYSVCVYGKTLDDCEVDPHNFNLALKVSYVRSVGMDY